MYLWTLVGGYIYTLARIHTSTLISQHMEPTISQKTHIFSMRSQPRIHMSSPTILFRVPDMDPN